MGRMRRFVWLAWMLIGCARGGGDPMDAGSSMDAMRAQDGSRVDSPPGIDASADSGPRDSGPPDAGVDGGPIVTWATTAEDRACTDGMRHVYVCPAAGVADSVRGTGTYTADSSVCTAAVHAGRITLSGGSIEIEMRAGRGGYDGSTRFGVTSISHGAAPCSFAVLEPACPLARTDCGDLCVEDLSTDRFACGSCINDCGADGTCAAGRCAFSVGWGTTAQEHDCGTVGVIGTRYPYICPAGGTVASVWGTDIYTHDSSICTAAVHAGRATIANGGLVVIEMNAGQASYTGSTRNGITSSSYGSWPCSYRFPP